MIYLIGGSPRCGKTILAKKIAHDKKISCVSTDALRAAILNTVPKSQRQKKFPQEAMPTPPTKFRFDVYSPAAQLKAQLVEAETMWPGVMAFIKSLSNREQQYVVEGVHLLPRLVNQLKKTSYWKDIKVVYLAKKDLAKIIKDFPKNKDEYDWMLPTIQHDKARLRKAALMTQVKSQYFDREAKKYHLKVFNTDSNFQKKLRQAQRYLIKSNN